MFEYENKGLEKFLNNISNDSRVIIKIKKFIDILDAYQKKMNLIGKSTKAYIWERHILDSAQIEQYLCKEEKTNNIIDVGTGAGFPGIVLAILGRKNLMLCEKSKKKINFLNQVVKELKLKVDILEGRIEDLHIENVKTFIGRAFAPLRIFFNENKAFNI